ncbi:MAG: ATP-binding protein [Candidatus Eiseniibacteriota bacterium]
MLLAAPRRIGKTSLLKETLQRLDERGRDLTLFVDLQACETADDVVVALSLATQAHRTLWRRTLDTIATSLGQARGTIESLSLDQIELKFREATAEAWQPRGQSLLGELVKAEHPIVLCLDELPVALSRLLRGGQKDITAEGRRQADVLLSWLRKACIEHMGRLRIVVCGSIGLEPVVHRVDLSHTINHLRPFHLAPWPREVADACLAALAANYEIQLPPDVRRVMLDRIGVCVPHHVQMYFGVLLDDCIRRVTRTPSAKDAGRIYDHAMLGNRGHAELADYEERLLRVLAPEIVPLALDVLTEAAVVGLLTAEALDILVRHNIIDPGEQRAARGDVLGVLEHDGYLEQDPATPDTYRFASHLLRDWWKRRFGDGYVSARKRR